MSRLSQGLDGVRRAIRICLLLALALGLLGLRELGDTSVRTFTGRRAGLDDFLYTQFGSAGLAARWFVPAVVLLIVARFIWRHADRTPRDRWYRR